jgi:hypothetical protein
MNNGYSLTRRWFDFAFEHKEAKVQHTALYLWIVELNNRLGWKSEIGVPTQATMDGLSIGNKQTYYSALRDLEQWGFIRIVEAARNQFSSTIVSVSRVEKDTAPTTALDTALTQHSSSTIVGSVLIDKPTNKETNKQRNVKQGFTPPTVNEVEGFMSERNAAANSRWIPARVTTEAKGFYDYYTSQGWKVGRNPMRDWQAAARNWMNNAEKYDKNGKFTRKNNTVDSVNRAQELATEALSFLRAGTIDSAT